MSAIKKYREKSGITQEKLAAKLKVGRTAVAMWETGKSLPRADKLTQLSKIFNCTIDELLASSNK